MSDDDHKWSHRGEWQDWDVSHDFVTSKFYLTIEANQGLPNWTSLSQLRLYEPATYSTATALVELEWNAAKPDSSGEGESFDVNRWRLKPDRTFVNERSGWKGTGDARGNGNGIVLRMD